MREFRSLRDCGLPFPPFRISRAPLFCLLAAIVLLQLAAAFPQAADKTWTEETLTHLSLRDKIAQLVQIRVPGKFLNRQSPEFQEIKKQIVQNHVGGIVLFSGNVYESAILLNELQELSSLPLIAAADFERGLSFRIEDATSFPWTMAIGATGSEEFSFRQGLITGEESLALGVHWIFAPVIDVNNNPDNPVINIRSFGEDPELVARLGAAFIRGAKKAGALTTAKHFPGHGDTATDSHLDLAVVESGLDRLHAVEFVPFKRAIEAGVDSIMTAHVAAPQVTARPDLPATLSPRILTDILRKTLNFGGIVVTDALEMGAITNTYWGGQAAVLAVKAGADVLLLPTDAGVAINEVERAVKRGDLSEARIDQSVRRILNAKSRLGLHTNRKIEISRIAEVVAAPESQRLAQEIADRSITVVKDEQKLLPISPLNNTQIFSLVLAPGLESSPGAVFQAEMRRRFLSVRTSWINERISEELLAGIDGAIAASDVIVCSTLARLTSGQNTSAIPGNQLSILKKVAASGKPVIWVAFGNPYVLTLVQGIGTSICTFSYSDVSQIAAAKAIAGEIAITGKMPVSIPGVSKPGDGIEIPKLETSLKPLSSETPDSFEQTGKLLQSFVKSGIFPGAQLTAAYKGSIVVDVCAGKTGSPRNPVRVSPETVYALHSLSEPVGTASAAMLALESGILLPEALVRDYLPEIKAKASEKLRIRELMRNPSGRRRTIEQIVDRAAGIPTGLFLTECLFEPLGMKVLYHSGSAGTEFSCSSRDLAVFAQMMLNLGTYNHRRYLNPSTIQKYTGPGGWWTKSSGTNWPGGWLSQSSYGHASPSGPVLWIDPAKQLFVILLANPGTASKETIGQIQRAILESVVAEIKKFE